MYRYLEPRSRRELPLGMLFAPTGDGGFSRACEANHFRGLVAALLDDPGYETADPETRLVQRLRLADDIGLLEEIAVRARPRISDDRGPASIDVSSDEPFVRSLAALGYVSLEPQLHSGSRPR